MAINNLEKRPSIGTNRKLLTQYENFEMLIRELNKRTLSVEVENTINKKIEELNALVDSDKEWSRKLTKTKSEVVSLLEKKLKLVTKNHYRNIWMALGMTAFGLPFGVVFGLSLDNMGLFGIGIPIGMAMGIAVGMSLDKKAAESGNQLDVEFKH